MLPRSKEGGCECQGVQWHEGSDRKDTGRSSVMRCSPGRRSVVYGVGAHHMGGADEHATVEDLKTVFAVHAFAAFDYLHGR